MEKSSFLGHLQELRSRILKSLVVILTCFLALVYFSNDIYLMLSEPMLSFLPDDSSMIATEVASPFLTPLKLTFYASLLLSMPFLLNQIWKFIAPGMYENEKSLSFLLMLSGLILFYLGVLFTYFLVLPIVVQLIPFDLPLFLKLMTCIP